VLLLAVAVQAIDQPAAHAVGVVYDPGVPSRQRYSGAYAVNTEGYIVGRNGTQAVAWTPSFVSSGCPDSPGPRPARHRRQL
jgi:hypothetical protein